MKHRILFISALIGLVTGAILLPLVASAVDWGSAVNLGSGGATPAAAIDSNGHFHAVWADTTSHKIQYIECDDLATNTCTSPTAVSNTGVSSNPKIAIDLLNRPNVVWQVKAGKRNAIYWSRLDSGTWSTPLLISAKGNNTLPDIAIGAAGNIHVVYQSIQNKVGYVVYVPNVGGSHFGAAETVDTLDVAPVTDSPAPSGSGLAKVSKGLNPRVAADSTDHPHIVWNAPSRSYGVFYTYHDNTNKFVSKIQVAAKNKDQMPAIAISPSDVVGIVWTSKAKATVGLAQFLQGARTYAGLGISMGLKSSSNAQIASDCWGGFQVVFQGVEAAGKKTQIYQRSFDPKEDVFQEQEQLSNPAQQTQTPAIAAAGKGAVVYLNSTAGKIQASAATFIPDCNNPPTPTPTLTPPSGNEHIANDDPRIAYTGPWTLLSDAHATEGDYLRCSGLPKCTSEWSADLTFVGGTRIEWETAAAKSFGRAQVRVDGQLFEQIDFCKLNPNSALLKFIKRTYILSGDANTPHELKITAMGDHSSCSPQDLNYVVVDGFNIVRP